jgi:hypothetical protein
MWWHVLKLLLLQNVSREQLKVLQGKYKAKPMGANT